MNKQEVINNDIIASLNREGNAYSAGRHLYHQIKRTEKSPVIASSIDEAVEFKFGEEEKGGIIIFSTDINVTEGGILTKLKNKLKTWFNRLSADKKLNKVSEKYSPQGWTVGKFLRGRYRARNGKLFDENSLSIEVIGLDSNELIAMAEEICSEFEQETVLVKDYISHDVMLVNSDKINESRQNIHNVEFSDIKWVEAGDLPETITTMVDFGDVDIDNDEKVSDFLSDWLSDEYGYVHEGFTFDIID